MERASVTFSFLLAPQSPLSLPLDIHLPSPLLTKTPKDSSTPHRPCLPRPRLLLVRLSPSPPCPLHQQPSLHVPFPILPPTLLNTEPPGSMDLPWISPGSPYLPTDTHLRVFPCFPSLASLVSPSSPYPCFTVTLSYFYL